MRGVAFLSLDAHAVTSAAASADDELPVFMYMCETSDIDDIKCGLTSSYMFSNIHALHDCMHDGTHVTPSGHTAQNSHLVLS